MSRFKITVLPNERVITAQEGASVLSVLRESGILVDAPCGGNGSCGKCRCLIDGIPRLACRSVVEKDCTVIPLSLSDADILTAGVCVPKQTDGRNRYVLAFDIGTTTVVGYLLDGRNCETLATASRLNPQTAYGSDVISRIQYVMEHPDSNALRRCILECLSELGEELAQSANISLLSVTCACIAGNTVMHHLLLGIDPAPLTVPPYMPACLRQMELPAGELLPINPAGTVQILPNIAGFVGGDTVACMAATAFDTLDDLTLMIDIGTNGEIVLGDRYRRIACSSAAGPAFEGAKIRHGMRGACGAISRVTLNEDGFDCTVIGGGAAVGICGSGLLDAVWEMRRAGMVEESGRMNETVGDPVLWGYVDNMKAIRLTADVWVTQKDIRELQLAKAAIQAGIELLLRRYHAVPEDVRQVYLAGAFGSFLSPEAACGLGMIPTAFLEKIQPIGNAAGMGAQLCALDRGTFIHTEEMARQTEFLELASMPEFQDIYVDCLSLGDDIYGE